MPASLAPADAGPTIVVSHDGSVTLHVVRQPLQWVLAELERHSVAAGIDKFAVPANAGPGETRPETSVAAAVARPVDVANRVMRGTEVERYDGLVEAQQSGAMSESMLKTLYETDASPRVRLLAFNYSLEGTEADPAARRSALEAAKLLPDAVIAQEAARLLEAMPRDEPGHNDAQQVAAQR